MSQATERPEAAESLPPEPTGTVEEKPEGAAEQKAAVAAEAKAEPASEEEPAPAGGPPGAAEGVAPLGEVTTPAGQPTTAPAARPERKRRGRYAPRRKVCSFCVDHVDEIDYKEGPKLRRYLSDRGKIEPRRKTGTCAKHQRRLSIALKRARHLALLPYTGDHIRLTGAFAPRS